MSEIVIIQAVILVASIAACVISGAAIRKCDAIIDESDPGTCRNIAGAAVCDDESCSFFCSECGFSADSDREFEHCPHCTREVVE